MTTPGHTPESPEHPDTAATSSSTCCGGHGAREDLGTPTMGHPDAPAPEADHGDAGDDLPADPADTSGCCGGHSPTDPAVEDEGQEGSCGADGDADEAAPQRDELAEAIEAQQRLAAEYANYRRRMERDRQANATAAKADVFAELLPILDDLDLAKKHGDLTGPLKAVNDKLRAACSKHTVTQFGDEGDTFNPDIHEAVQDSSTGDNKVLGAVLRPGFMIGDRLIRTAMVTVADGE